MNFIDRFWWVFVILLYWFWYPILFYIRKYHYGSVLLSFRTTQIPRKYSSILLHNFAFLIVTFLILGSIPTNLVHMIIMILLIAIFYLVSLTFFKTEVREKGICSILGCWKWGNIAYYTVEKRKKGYCFYIYVSESSIFNTLHEITWKISIYEKEKLEEVLVDKKVRESRPSVAIE